jgi:hypothetical protein
MFTRSFGSNNLSSFSAWFLAWSETVLCQERNRVSFKAHALLEPHSRPAPSGRIVAANALPRGYSRSSALRVLRRMAGKSSVEARDASWDAIQALHSAEASHDVFAIIPLSQIGAARFTQTKRHPHWTNAAAGGAAGKGARCQIKPARPRPPPRCRKSR